jgi:hypothetical protein
VEEKEIMPCPEVDFRDKDEKGEPCHRYYLDGKEIPGLSYILDSCGLCRYDKVRKDVMEAARERGDAAHFATRLFDEDNPRDMLKIDIWEKEALAEPLDSWTRSRLVGWCKFRGDFNYQPILTEKAMSHCLHGMAYAFTLDSYGTGSLGNMLIEKKCTSGIEPSHAIQTAAQALPFKESNVVRLAVYLLENDYKVIKCDDRQDERLFGCALALVHWRWGKGIRP